MNMYGIGTNLLHDGINEFAGTYALMLETLHVTAPLIGKRFMSCDEVLSANNEAREMGAKYVYQLGGRILSQWEYFIRTDCS